MQLAEEVIRGTLKYIINGNLAYVRLDPGDGGASYVEMRSQPLINAGVGIGDVFELHAHVSTSAIVPYNCKIVMCANKE